MTFISIRDFRSNSAKIRNMLPEEKELVLTANGKPIAILSAISEDTLEETLAAIRNARALQALTQMQLDSVKKGKDKISLNEINKEIKAARGDRKSK